jgi:hypothetical protein
MGSALFLEWVVRAERDDGREGAFRIRDSAFRKRLRCSPTLNPYYTNGTMT